MTRELYGANLRKTPLVLTGIFVELLRLHFSSNKGQFRYTNDPVKTDLLIEASYNWDPEKANKRPACYVKRGNLSYTKLVIDNLQHIAHIEGSETYVKSCRGNYTLLCICENIGTTERLSEEVSELFLAYESKIREEFDFKEIHVEALGEISVLKGYQNLYVVPVILSFFFTEAWQIILPQLKLGKIVYQLDLPSMDKAP